jgi:hypothetical protein
VKNTQQRRRGGIDAGCCWLFGAHDGEVLNASKVQTGFIVLSVVLAGLRWLDA